MKRRNWFRKSRKQSKPQDKPAAEYSVDEILSEFRHEYAEPEDETMEQGLPADEPEDSGTVLQEYEETETEEVDDKNDDSAQEELPVYSVRDILRDYRLMTMENRYEEEAREPETLPPAEQKPAEPEKPAGRSPFNWIRRK